MKKLLIKCYTSLEAFEKAGAKPCGPNCPNPIECTVAGYLGCWDTHDVLGDFQIIETEEDAPEGSFKNMLIKEEKK